MRKHWRIIALGILVSGAAVYMIVSSINMALLLEALRSASLIWLPIAALGAVISLAARSVRWRVLLSGGLTPTRSFYILNIAYLVNGLIPLRVGEVGRMWLASRGENSVPVFKSASTIIVERLLDLLTVVLFIAVSLASAANAVPDQLRATAAFMGVVSVVGFLMLVLFASQRQLAQSILAFFVKRIMLLQRFDLANWLDHFLDGLMPFTHSAAFANTILWTAISWGISVAYGYMLMLAFYPQGDLIATLLFIAAASFAVALPAVPGNIGTYELSILLGLSALGYTDTPAELATATAFAIVVHFVNLAVNALLGVLGFLAEGVSLEQLSQGVQQMQQAQASPPVHER